MIISSGESDSAAPILQFLTKVYEDDLRLGTNYTNLPSYSDADLKIISSPSVRPVDLPAPPSNRYFVSPPPEAVTADMEVVLVMCTIALLNSCRSCPLLYMRRSMRVTEWSDRNILLSAGYFHESGLRTGYAGRRYFRGKLFVGDLHLPNQQ